MRLALMLGGLAAGRKAGGPGQLLVQGTKLLGQSPEMTRLTDEVRGRLLDAGKAAAMAVATRQVEALTERVVGRVGALTEVSGQTVSDVGDTVGDVGRSVADVGQRAGRKTRQDGDRYGHAAEDAAEDAETEDAASADDEDTTFDEGSPDDEGDVEDAPDEGDEEEEHSVEATPPPRRRAPSTAASARRAGAAAARAAVAATGTGGGSAKAATGRRAGRSARARQGGTND
jgi:hypothetical protein